MGPPSSSTSSTSSTSSPPRAVRRGPFVPEPRPDPREAMALLERRIRELTGDAPPSDGPMSLRGQPLARALRDIPISSGIRRRF